MTKARPAYAMGSSSQNSRLKCTSGSFSGLSRAALTSQTNTECCPTELSWMISQSSAARPLVSAGIPLAMSVHFAGSNRPEPLKLADENSSASSTCSEARKLMHRRLVARIMSCAWASRLTQTTSVGGSSVSEQTAVMVRPRRSPFLALVQMQTPPANSRMLCLKTSAEIGTSLVTAASAIAMLDPCSTESAAASIRGLRHTQNFMSRAPGAEAVPAAWRGRLFAEVPYLRMSFSVPIFPGHALRRSAQLFAEPLAHPVASLVDCGKAGAQQHVEQRKRVRHFRRHVQLHLDAGHRRLVGEGDRIRQQHFLAADLDQHRRQAGHVGADRRGQGIVGLAAEIGLRDQLDAFFGDHRVARADLLIRLGRRRHVEPGAQQVEASRLRQPFLAQLQQQRGGEIATRRLAADDEIVGRKAHGEDLAISLDRILDRGGIRMLRCKPIVDVESGDAARGRQSRYERAMALDAAEHVAAAVEVEQCLARRDIRRRDLLG